MHFVKSTIASIITLSLLGCTSNSSNENVVLSKFYTQADLDLIIGKAKEEERQRIQSEIGQQQAQKKLFDEIRARQNGTNQSSVEQQQSVQINPKSVTKIVPKNRTPVLYKEVNGQAYMRCAANALLASKAQSGAWEYSPQKKELSATLCKRSRDMATMQALQTILFESGYLTSNTLTKDQLVDGVWGETTLVAVKKYQQEHGLLFGQLTIETLESLGVFPSEPQADDMLGVNSIQLALVPESTETKTQSDAVQTPVVSSLNTIDVSVEDVKPEVESLSKNSDIAVSTEALVPVTKSGLKAESHTLIEKIIPTSRNPELYKNLEGVNYMRCAANALIPVQNEQGGWVYSQDRKELSATLCKTSRDMATMTDLQYTLHEKGYLRSEELTKDQLIDGTWGTTTLVAVKDYQQKNGLLYGQLTIETLEHIGVFEPDENRIVTQTTEKTLDKTIEQQEVIKESIVVEAKQSEQEVSTVQEIELKPAVLVEPIKVQKQHVVVEFVPLKVQLANPSFDAGMDIPKSPEPQVYAYVKKFPLWRCRARSILPEKNASGLVEYADKKRFTATLCKANRTIKLITRLQAVLRDKGYLKSKLAGQDVVIDGVWGADTLLAVKEYQKANGLPYGQLTIETLEHIGVFEPLEVKSTVQSNEPVVEKTIAVKQQENLVPFIPLNIRPVDSDFDARSFIPTTSKPQLYAYVRKFPLWRCGARSIMPEKDDTGAVTYSDNKRFTATLCKTNRTIKLITRLQAALRDKGYLKSSIDGQSVIIDGVWGEETLSAVKAYQKANGLAYGQLTIEIMEHLGVFIKQ